MKAILKNIKAEEGIKEKTGGLHDYADKFVVGLQQEPTDLLIQQPRPDGIIEHEQQREWQNQKMTEHVFRDENPNIMQKMFGGVFMGMGVNNQQEEFQNRNYGGNAFHNQSNNNYQPQLMSNQQFQPNQYPPQQYQPQNMYPAQNQYQPQYQQNPQNQGYPYQNVPPNDYHVKANNNGFFGK